MQLISVAGATSKSGKTTLVCNLLGAFGHWRASAVKFSTNYGKPRGCHLGSPCEVCDLNDGFRIITDPAIIRVHDKDTGRFSDAGARQVIWTIAREYATAAAWDATLETLAGDSMVVIEGSRVVSVAQPSMRFYLVHAAIPPAQWKDSAASLIRGADVVVINTQNGVAVRDGVREAVIMLRGGEDFVEGNVSQPIASWLPASPANKLTNLFTSGNIL